MIEYPLSASGVQIPAKDSFSYVSDFTAAMLEDLGVERHIRPFALALSRSFASRAFSGQGLGQKPVPRKELPDGVLQSVCVTALNAAVELYRAGRLAQAEGRFRVWAEENRISKEIQELF